MNSIKNVLAVQSETDTTTMALDHAVVLAEHHAASLVLVDVKAYLDAYVDALADLMPKEELRAKVIDHRKKQLQSILTRQSGSAGLTADAKVFDGVPFIEIIREVNSAEVDLVVKVADGGSHDGDVLLGTTDMHLIRKSPVPVWIINQNSPPPQKIVAAIDAVATCAESEFFNQQILTLAKTLSDIWTAELHVVSVWHLEGENTMLVNPFLKIDEKRVADLLDQAKSRVLRHQNELGSWFRRMYPDTPEPIYHCVKGPAGQAIPEFVREQNAGLLVMGSVSRIDIPGLLIASTAESILGEINCSVATIKPKGFVSPVVGP